MFFTLSHSQEGTFEKYAASSHLYTLESQLSRPLE